MAKSRSGATRACNRCKTQLSAGARRCKQCGAQVRSAEADDPSTAADRERERFMRRYKLSEIQLEILSSAGTEGQSIFVCGNRMGAEGEVKSGERRFYGDEAVVAVAVLAGPGLIESSGDDCFRVTADGRKVIDVLNPAGISDG